MFRWFKKESTPTQVAPTYHYHDISAIATYFQEETGVNFDKHTSILHNKVTAFCKQREIYNFETLHHSLLNNDARLKQELIDHLTTNETYFYREFKQIQTLCEVAKKEKGTLRILSAPCATGEEPYSMAIALIEAGVNPEKFHIVAVDINEDAIALSKDATYKKRSVHKLSAEILQKYFSYHDERYHLKNTIKQQVSFEKQNIFDASFTDIGKFDFIFSRNMLIYFDQANKQKARGILEGLRKSDQHAVFFGHADLF